MDDTMPTRRLIVLSAPSGAGKTTVAHHLLKHFPMLRFSISATTRTQRPGEVNGQDYLFLTRHEFATAIDANNLIEYEEIFGNYYGTLRSQVEDALERGECLLFDVDVKGALSLRHAFPNDALLVFIAPPSLEILADRLTNRHTETEAQIALRLSRAEMEMAERDHFDVVIVNNGLQDALTEAEGVVRKFASL